MALPNQYSHELKLKKDFLLTDLRDGAAEFDLSSPEVSSTINANIFGFQTFTYDQKSSDCNSTHAECNLRQ